MMKTQRFLAANIAANTSDDGTGNCDVDVAIPDATFADNCSGVSLAWAMTGAVTDNANGQVRNPLPNRYNNNYIHSDWRFKQNSNVVIDGYSYR